MIVSCPACATRFSLDAALLGEAGRNVRCAKCSHKWRQLPPKIEAPEGTPIAPEPAGAPAEPVAAPPQAEATDITAAQDAAAEPPAVEIPAAPPRPRSPQRPTGPITVPPKLRPVMPKRRSILGPVLLLLLGLLIGLAAAAYYFRSEIARAVPAFEMAYGLMGISTSNPAQDLEIGNLVFDRRNSDGRSAISIQGDIFNPSQFPVKLPHLVAIPLRRDEAGNEVLLEPSHAFRLEQEIIEPGETVTFRTFFENLPKGTRSLKVTFLQ
ncbi:putative Zn finger-like uncharacterized protein [Dongia mobilis]|uniref:Putative Zn finger-like uncharacterized protein n=1 Tax=Dongia mobilis TaxID=578943 RepID=A0A4R6WW65_9PROT|nr:putative Zn finger-like uncharacterized protein [Dongia mobilis]